MSFHAITCLILEVPYLAKLHNEMVIKHRIMELRILRPLHGIPLDDPESSGRHLPTVADLRQLQEFTGWHLGELVKDNRRTKPSGWTQKEWLFIEFFRIFGGIEAPQEILFIFKPIYESNGELLCANQSYSPLEEFAFCLAVSTYL